MTEIKEGIFMLEIKNLSKRYKKADVKAIDDINLTINKGEIYGFIGPNGAGKSTTIKCVVGIIEFDEGDVLLDGVSIKDDPMLIKSKISYVPDNPDLYENLAAIKYLDFISNIYNIGEERNEIIHKYASMFGIEDKLANPIKTYSHGMKQKLAIIAALVHKPELIILDEPFVGLDPKAAYDLKQMLRSLCEEGMMVFFSSHVLEVVEKFCDKVAIIKSGKLIASGTMEDVKGDDSLENVFLETTEE